MGRRVGQLAGLFAFALVLGRLGRLLQTGPNEPRWNLILGAAAFLGAVAWWLLAQVVTRTWVRVTVFALAGLLLAFRIAAPETLWIEFVPTGSTLAVMGDHLAVAFRIIQSGVPPVAANPGLMAILAVLMWVIGSLYTWGSTTGPYAAMFLPSLIMYFQFAVFDRVEAGLGWLMASSVALGLSVVSVALERREDAGRARDSEGHPIARRSIGLAAALAGVLAVGAIVVADSASALISEYGNAPWRGGSGGGYGTGTGGTTFHRLVDLRQQIISRTNEIMFVATFGQNAPAPSNVYWRVETLDDFDGVEWKRSDLSLRQFQPGRPLANEFDVYQGTINDFLSVVRIQGLDTDVAPTPGVPVDIQEAPDPSAGRDPGEFQVLSDSAILMPTRLGNGDEYQVRVVTADLAADLGALASNDNGELTPLFQALARSGNFAFSPSVPTGEAVEPPDLDLYTKLPPDLPSNIRNLAVSVTREASTPFEAAWVLQSWFRDGWGQFRYSTDVETGHDSLVLNDWLTRPNSPNYRTGYCEQFAAAMAVMARTIGIPSRVVWGFTPGATVGDQIVVRDTNAHAWVELWMEPYGWVQFDPTPRSEQEGFDQQPLSITGGIDARDFLPETVAGDPVTTPTGPEGLPEDPAFVDVVPGAGTGSGPAWWLIGVATIIVLVAAIPLFKRIRRRRRLARIREGDITAVWDEIVDRLVDLRIDVPDTLTPMEIARRTDPSLVPVAASYGSTVYGGRTGQARESDLFGAEWWMDRTFDTATRARAAVSLRSLTNRR